MNFQDEQRRCSGATKAGNPCRSRAVPDSDFCVFHDEEHEVTEMARNGGLKTQARRGVRERFREDAELHYDKLIGSLLDAVEAETVRRGDCPECKHRVPVSFPDIRARTQAIQVLIDQGYGKPTETTRIETEDEKQQKALRSMSDTDLTIALFTKTVDALVNLGPDEKNALARQAHQLSKEERTALAQALGFPEDVCEASEETSESACQTPCENPRHQARTPRAERARQALAEHEGSDAGGTWPPSVASRAPEASGAACSPGARSASFND
jgi:hypothetical protein